MKAWGYRLQLDNLTESLIEDINKVLEKFPLIELHEKEIIISDELKTKIVAVTVHGIIINSYYDNDEVYEEYTQSFFETDINILIKVLDIIEERLF